MEAQKDLTQLQISDFVVTKIFCHRILILQTLPGAACPKFIL